MIYRLFFLIISFLLFSCASITLESSYKLKVKSDVASKIKYQDSTYNLPTEIEVYRSPKPLLLTYIVDSLKTKISVESQLNPTYKYGNMLCFPSGYIVDMLNDKRFYYGKILILNSNTVMLDSKKLLIEPPKELKTYTKNQLITKFVSEISKFRYHFSIPIACNFYMQPVGQGVKKGVGFGITAGMDYFYKKNKFVSFTVAGFTNKFGFNRYDYLDEFYEYERLSATNFSLTDNFKINRFSLGYGLNFSENNWYFEDRLDIDDFIVRTKKERFNQNLGFVFTGYFKVYKCIHIGVNYRPTILQVDPSTKFLYQHIFGFDFQFKF